MADRNGKHKGDTPGKVSRKQQTLSRQIFSRQRIGQAGRDRPLARTVGISMPAAVKGERSRGTVTTPASLKPVSISASSSYQTCNRTECLLHVACPEHLGVICLRIEEPVLRRMRSLLANCMQVETQTAATHGEP